MNFRASSIYISATTRRMLRVIAKSEGVDTTVDEVGDRILSSYITTRYPALAAHQKHIEELESSLIEGMKGA